MKAKELRENSEKQLQVLVKDGKEKLKDLRFSLANRQLKDYSEIKKIRKTIARVKSVLKEKRVNNKK